MVLKYGKAKWVILLFAQITVLLLKTAQGEIPYTYPLFKQCNASWGNDIMVSTTICKVGCLMSSTSMALKGNGIEIDGKISANPGTLNQWLKNNNGYDSSNDFKESVLPNITKDGAVTWPKDGMHKTNDLQLQTVQLYLEQGRVMIANVMNGSHFVLVTGWDDDFPDTMLVSKFSLFFRTLSNQTGLTHYLQYTPLHR